MTSRTPMTQCSVTKPLSSSKEVLSVKVNIKQAFQEFQNFTDYKFEDDGNVVSYRYWVRTEGDHKGMINFANFIAIGAWYQMKNTEPASLALQAFSSFYFELKKFIYYTMQSQTVRPTFLTENSAKQTFLKEFPLEQQNFIWFDPKFGMENITAFVFWVEATDKGVNSGQSMFLKDYFMLTYLQMGDILKSLASLIDGANKLLTQFYCSETFDKKCHSEFLAARQWVSQGITMNTPPGVPPTPSVITGNATSHGYPELSYFYTEYFLKKIDSSPEFQGITFSTEWGLKVLDHYANYSLEDPQYYTYPHILMHIGNMRFLYEQGGLYDKTKTTSYMENIKKRFLLDTWQQARVFWEYIKYFEVEFAVQKSINGTMGIAAMGTVISQSLYGDIMVLSERLLDTILEEVIFKDIKNCSFVIEKIYDVTEETKQRFCSLSEFSPWRKESVGTLIDLCENQMSEYWEQLVVKFGLEEYQLMQICGDENAGFGMVLAKTHSLLKEQYSCDFSKCRKYELALKQWAYSTVSQFPINKIYRPSMSIHDAFPSLFLHKFEYSWFISEFGDVTTPRNITRNELEYLLSFDCLFNGQMVSNAFIYFVNKDLEAFKTWFIFESFDFLHYLRYVMISIGLDGFADRREIDEILFGYWPTILQALKTMNPAMGGDPSIPIAGLNLNIPDLESSHQSMYTGKNDTSLVRKYSTIDGLAYLNVKQPYFNGNVSTFRQINPWKQEVSCRSGTDALSYAPGQEEGGSIVTVITDLVRSVTLNYESTIDFHGLKAYRYLLDPKELEKNDVYHSLKWNGLINFTTVQNAPIINSLRHFRLASEELKQMVEVYKDGEKTQRQWDSEWDDSYIVVEPLTGVALAALLNLQINVEYESDILFPGNNYAVLPILSLWRGANWTEEQINITFADLKTGFTIIFALKLVGYIAGPLLLLGGGGLYYWKVWRVKKKQEMNTTLIPVSVENDQSFAPSEHKVNPG